MGDDEIADLRASLAALALKVETAAAPKLWTRAHIASWLSLSERTVEAITVRPGFPKPIAVTGSAQGGRRWFMAEVVEWAERNRSKLQRGAKVA